MAKASAAPPTPPAPPAPEEPLFGRIPVEQIKVPADHARSPGDIDGLKESMSLNGLLQPILVRQIAPDQFELMAGGRRLRAAQELKWETIAAQVRGADELTRHVFRTIENVQREQYGAVEEAKEYELLAAAPFSLPNQEIARRVGRSPLHVSQRRALLLLPEKYQQLIEAPVEGGLRIGEGIELARLASAPELLESAYKAIVGGTPAQGAVQAMLTRMAQSSQHDQRRKEITDAGKVVFGGVIGREGWRVDPEPGPGIFYWPSDRSAHEGFQWGVSADGSEVFAVCVNPLVHLNDPDQQVAQSAQALIEGTRAGTVAEPARGVSPDEAAKLREQAERRHFRDLRKQDELREAHLGKRAKAAVSADSVDMILEILVEAMPATTRETVYARCNVARVQAAEGEGFGERWDLAKYLEGRGSWRKLAYALALQLREDVVDGAVKSKTRMLHGTQAEQVKAYFEHLESTGYVLSKGERELADMEPGDEPDKDEDDDEGEPDKD